MKFLKISKQKIGIAGKILLIVVVLLSIVFIATSSFSDVTFSNVTGTIKAFFLNLKRGPGYPYEFSADGPEKIDSIGYYIAVVEDSTVVFLNSTAKEVFRYDTTYTNPDVRISNGRALIYNRGTSSFMVAGQSDMIYDNSETSGVITESIITAAIGKKGNLGFATWSDDGVSKFTAVNKKLGVDFYYVFGNDRIMYIALSDNGKYAACAVFGVKNATYYSKVHVFDFEQTEPIATFEYPAETLIRLDFVDNETLSVVTDLKRRLVSVEDKSESGVVDYSTHSLSSVDFDAGSHKSVLCFSKYGSTENEVYAFDKNGEEIFHSNDFENVKDVKCNSKFFAVLTDEYVYSYNYKGELKSKIELSVNIDSIEIVSNDIYFFSGSNVYKMKSNKDGILQTE
ncbi:MAG: hypothetical protein E7536_00475 [Ruminococcaceae bacterium]|nr:hypothetical protein [Oscillospiraceae bacterium]